MGQRASDLCQLAFEDLEIAPDMMLGEEGQGYRIALENLTTGRIGIGHNRSVSRGPPSNAREITPRSGRPLAR